MENKMPIDDYSALIPTNNELQAFPPVAGPSSALITDISTNVQQKVVVIHHVNYGPKSQRVKCPHCLADVATRIMRKGNTKTHVVAMMMCHVGLCCCIPCIYCTDRCLPTKHYCPSCKRYLGQHDN